MKKLVFIVGLAVGYVIGTRQGRAGYENLKNRANELWRNPRVQRTVSDAQKVVRDKAPGVSDAVSRVVGKADAASDSVVASSDPGEDLPRNV